MTNKTQAAAPAVQKEDKKGHNNSPEVKAHPAIHPQTPKVKFIAPQHIAQIAAVLDFSLDY